MGDGELALLGYRTEAPWEHTSRSLNIWFGHDKFRHEDLLGVADRLRNAVRSATVVGVPRESRQRREVYCGYASRVLSRYGLERPGHLYTDCGIHRFWQMLLAYRDLLQGLPFVGIISSRNVGEHLGRVFEIRDVAFYPVPPEHACGDRRHSRWSVTKILRTFGPTRSPIVSVHQLAQATLGLIRPEMKKGRS